MPRGLESGAANAGRTNGSPKTLVSLVEGANGYSIVEAEEEDLLDDDGDLVEEIEADVDVDVDVDADVDAEVDADADGWEEEVASPDDDAEDDVEEDDDMSDGDTSKAD